MLVSLASPFYIYIYIYIVHCVFVGTFFACLRQFYFLTQTEYFAWAIYSLCIVAIFGHFQNGLIFRILDVLSSCFLYGTAVMC